jgi:hypothetical protein
MLRFNITQPISHQSKMLIDFAHHQVQAGLTPDGFASALYERGWR